MFIFWLFSKAGLWLIQHLFLMNLGQWEARLLETLQKLSSYQTFPKLTSDWSNMALSQICVNESQDLGEPSKHKDSIYWIKTLLEDINII